MKIKEVLVGWPLEKWVAEDPENGDLTHSPGELQLLWFTSPDPDGWFSLTAIDHDGREWSTYCRVQRSDIWQRLEPTLARNLRTPLGAMGEIDLNQKRA